MALFMAFGVAFEVPVAIVLLCWVGVTTPDDLRKKRPYIWWGICRRYAVNATGRLLANLTGDTHVLPV